MSFENQQKCRSGQHFYEMNFAPIMVPRLLDRDGDRTAAALEVGLPLRALSEQLAL